VIFLEGSYFIGHVIFFSAGFYGPYGPWPYLMDLGLLGWGISPTQGLYRHIEQHNTETRRHTSML